MHLITENVPHCLLQEQDQCPAGACPWIELRNISSHWFQVIKTSWIQRKSRFAWHESCSHPTEDLQQLHRWWWSSSQFGFGLGMRAQVKPEVSNLLWTWPHISQCPKKSWNQPIQESNELYKKILDSSTHPAAPNAKESAPSWSTQERLLADNLIFFNGSPLTDLAFLKLPSFPLLSTEIENSSSAYSSPLNTWSLSMENITLRRSPVKLCNSLVLQCQVGKQQQFWKMQDLRETQRTIRFDEIHFLDGFWKIFVLIS